MAKTVQYPYAYNENNNFVFAGDINRDHRHDHIFHCPNCGQAMLPRLGENNAKHFYHSEGQACGVESYIHTSAKAIIRNRLNEGSSFFIGFTSERPCKYRESCIEDNTDECELLPEFGKYDLKLYYDQPADVEVDIVEPDGITHFRPDVLLRSSNPNRRDIFIEVYYKHRSDIEKLESGHQIIEIKVNGMGDLNQLALSDCILEGKHVHFYGFKPRYVNTTQIVNERKADYEANDHPFRYWDYPPCVQRRMRGEKGVQK